jgi:hypothetical protein
MDYLEFIARVTSHIPDKGQVTVTSSGRGFMLVREGRMGFQNDLGFVAGAARKKKFLSL